MTVGKADTDHDLLTVLHSLMGDATVSLVSFLAAAIMLHILN